MHSLLLSAITVGRHLLSFNYINSLPSLVKIQNEVPNQTSPLSFHTLHRGLTKGWPYFGQKLFTDLSQLILLFGYPTKIPLTLLLLGFKKGNNNNIYQPIKAFSGY